MSVTRRKITSVYGDFVSDITRLKRFDAQTQRNFTARGSPSISRWQLYQLTESIFFSSFRTFELFVRDIFLLYTLEKRPRSGRVVKSWLAPRDFLHAEGLIKSSMTHLDWTSPDVVIERTELYLKNGFPIKVPYTSRLSLLRDCKRLRNQIAHSSKEALNEYKKVLQSYYGTLPLSIPRVGAFLLEPDRINPSKHLLIKYLDEYLYLADNLT